MQILSQVAEIAILGAIGGSIPGPVLTAVFTEVMNGGFAKGFKVILRALAAEIIVAGSILLIAFALDIPQYCFYLISLFGAAFLVYLSFGVWKIDKIGGEKGEIFGFRKILLLTVLNGGFLIFWLTICVPRAFALKEQIAGGQIVFLAAFESGWIFSTSLLAFVFSRFRPLLLKKNLVSPVFKFFALVLVFFAAKSIYESAVYFFMINI